MGQVTSPGYNGLNFGPGVPVWVTGSLKAPVGLDVVMLSFLAPHHLPSDASVRLPLPFAGDPIMMNTFTIRQDDVTITLRHVDKGVAAFAVNLSLALTTPVVHEAVRVDVQYRSTTDVLTKGFLMRFSFHSHNHAPYRLPSGAWNCSAENYASWSHHLRCNLVKECSCRTRRQPLSRPATLGAGPLA
jgi:hypothetical protein